MADFIFQFVWSWFAVGFCTQDEKKTIILKSFSVSVRKKLQTIRMFKKVMRLRRIKSSPTMQSAN